MAEFTLMHLLDAATYETVEAETWQEALELSELETPTVCHQCSDKVELSGEVLKTIVLLDGEEVHAEDSFQEERFKADLRELDQAWGDRFAATLQSMRVSLDGPARDLRETVRKLAEVRVRLGLNKTEEVPQ